MKMNSYFTIEKKNATQNFIKYLSMIYQIYTYTGSKQIVFVVHHLLISSVL